MNCEPGMIAILVLICIQLGIISLQIAVLHLTLNGRRTRKTETANDIQG